MVVLFRRPSVAFVRSVLALAARLKSNEILRDSLPPTKNPGNLFGLESSKIAKKATNKRACRASIVLLVDILDSTKMSVEQVNLLPDRGSRDLLLQLLLKKYT